MGEFALRFGCHGTSDPHELARAAQHTGPVRLAYAVPVTPVEFDRFCRLAWVWIRLNALRGNQCTLVVEELADVTPPAKAPPAWGEIVRKAQRFGPAVFALTQRPQESDKTIMGNATTIRVHAMSRANDRRLMAAELDVPQPTVDALDLGAHEWLLRDRRDRSLYAGSDSSGPAKIAQAEAAGAGRKP